MRVLGDVPLRAPEPETGDMTSANEPPREIARAWEHALKTAYPPSRFQEGRARVSPVSPTDSGGRLIRFFGEALTPRQLEVLAVMAAHYEDDEGELCYERGVAYLGDVRIAARTVTALLRACAIRAEHEQNAPVERYRINSTGRALLAARKNVSTRRRATL